CCAESRSETAALQKEFESSLLHICLGFVGALVAYTFFLYFAMRVKRYRYYAIWNLCNLYLHYYKNGFIRNYWDFTNPIFTDTGWVLSFTFDCVFGLLFAVDFLEEPLAKLPKLKKIMMMHVWILLVTLPIAFFSTHVSLYLNLALLTTGGTMILYVSLLSLRYKKLYYYFNLISWIFVLPSATLNAFVTLGIIRSTFWSHNTMIIALLIESVLTAIAVSLLSGEILKNRFVDLKVKKHTLLQLKNLVYPHQVAQIEKGASVIDTMPIGRAEACVISFDIQDSTILGHEKNHEFFEAVMKRCHKMMLAYYQVDRMEANAYLIKEMGDGFLCSVGFPFKCRGDIFENSIALSEIFVEVFRSQAD
ncbi:MAG: membrane protein, partial [Proteobacteria bacterium]